MFMYFVLLVVNCIVYSLYVDDSLVVQTYLFIEF